MRPDVVVVIAPGSQFAASIDRYGCEIIAETVDFRSRPKAADGDAPELVDRDDEIGF